MMVRAYQPADCAEMSKLFYETVHTINAKDYTKLQLDAWANGDVDTSAWNRSFLEHNTLVAVENDAIVGFGDMENSGYLDRLYVHKEHQGKGIATAIANALEKQAEMCGTFRFTTCASITAKPFFEKQGYVVVRENTLIRHGVALTNFIMKKHTATYGGHAVRQQAAQE